MKKRYLLALTIAMTAALAWAAPAKRGLWKTLRLTDGTEVRAQLGGDEHVHFWQAEDGTRYVLSSTTADDEDIYQPIDDATLISRAMARRSRLQAHARQKSPRRVEIGERTQYLGKKKGIVILAQFTNSKFQAANDSARYCDILNKEGYNVGNFKGSVADYFKAQSAGQFELEFDVVGPINLNNNVSYYGRDDGGEGNDIHPGEMIIEACQQADRYVNFADYDWDGDGEVDQVFVVYAGKGQADGGASNTIWPHMWYLSEAEGTTLSLDGVTIDTYACSSELSGSSIAGIGTFCHEFSHCMGFPDFYDISYSGWFGMDDFDLMCSGSYLGSGFRPCGYTAHEKMMCGWQEPTVLSMRDTTVVDLQPMSNHGETFIIYNDAHPDEYYMIENRQKSGWDTNYPARGLMITHVDFDKDIWQANVPNTKVSKSEATQYGLPSGKGNDHMRMTIFHADNTATSYSTATDLYPYSKRDSLTATSIPGATLYNANSEGKKVMKGAILDIKQNSDGTMSFTFRSGYPQEDVDEPGTDEPGTDEPGTDQPGTDEPGTDEPGTDEPGTDEPGTDEPGTDEPGTDEPGTDEPGTDEPGTDEPGTDEPGTDEHESVVLFYESFNQCEGKGGNDGVWTTSIASSDFIADNEGWEALKPYGGYQCARFGNSSTHGIATSPIIDFDGSEATLTFKAAAWYQDGTELSLVVYNANGKQDPDAIITPSSVEMKSFEWTDYTVSIQGEGTLRIAFIPSKRFLLDEVKVTKPTAVTAIATVGCILPQGRIFTLDGRFVGTDATTLRPGIYVRDGKKFVR